MQRLLITGGSGLLALNWACCVRDRFEVVLGTHRHTVDLAGAQSVKLDLGSPKRFAKQLKEIAPSLVIHTAGMTSVEQCEQHPVDAERDNVHLAEQVAVATRMLEIKLVHVSTDHVFSGDRANASEADKPGPLNIYARTKLQAEKVVSEIHPRTLVVRTNFFGWGHAYRHSFSDWIIGSLRAGTEITMFDDVFFTPVLVDDLALATHDVLATGAYGVYHIVGEDRISKYEFAKRLVDEFELPKALIARGRIGNSTLTVPRPRDMSLDNAKVRGLLKRNIGSLDVFLERLHVQEQQGRAAELRNAVTER